MIDVWSGTARRIDVCLFDNVSARVESARIPLTRSGDRWSLEGTALSRGQLYALRVDGPSFPTSPPRFEPARFLLDPRARAIGRLPLPPDQLDPLSVVADDDGFDWHGDQRPNRSWADTVIYEAHVRGFTRLHPRLPEEIRGTFAGMGSAPVVEHLTALGVTAIELLPIHAHADEPALIARGLTNYWGYNTLSFFAPDPGLSSTPADPLAVVREFKEMVRALHAAHIEVILDVVYNHTSEGEMTGPTQSLRGIDPLNTYRWDPRRDGHYADWSGCGNTLNTDALHMRALVMDSLRYWATEMRVDGFRFDLASALDRAPGESDSFFAGILADPILAPLKLIVEPWDATSDGYRLGDFPAGVAEWNDRYRDDIRRFWRGDPGSAPDFATRLCGSDDRFTGRATHNSINFVTAHDGFTLNDLVTYAEKHNGENGEDNRDGTTNNFSSNSGIEGPTTDVAITIERTARQRAMITTLLLSLGTPMISGGDEFGRSQGGNNNAYCHDSPVAWTAWANPSMADLIARVAALRRSLPALRRDTHLTPDDAEWLTTSGAPLSEHDWRDAHTHALLLRIHDTGGDLLIVANNARQATTVALPADAQWRVLISSGGARIPDEHQDRCDVSAISIAVLQAVA